MRYPNINEAKIDIAKASAINRGPKMPEAFKRSITEPVTHNAKKTESLR
jgi:hypothetical protein